LLRRISQKSGMRANVVIDGPGIASGDRGTLLIDRLRAQLPLELQPHLAGCLEKPGELVLFVESAVWAARLKLCLPELPAIANGRRCTVRVMPRAGYRK
jgi:hypothetical protein